MFFRLCDQNLFKPCLHHWLFWSKSCLFEAILTILVSRSGPTPGSPPSCFGFPVQYPACWPVCPAEWGLWWRWPGPDSFPRCWIQPRWMKVRPEPHLDGPAGPGFVGAPLDPGSGVFQSSPWWHRAHTSTDSPTKKPRKFVAAENQWKVCRGPSSVSLCVELGLVVIFSRSGNIHTFNSFTATSHTCSRKNLCSSFEFSSSLALKISSSNFNSFPGRVWINMFGEFMMIGHQNANQINPGMWPDYMKRPCRWRTQKRPSPSHQPVSHWLMSQLVPKELTFLLPHALGLSATPREWGWGGMFFFFIFSSLSLTLF